MQNQWEARLVTEAKAHEQAIEAIESQLHAQKQLAHKSQVTVAAFHTLFKQMKKEVESLQLRAKANAVADNEDDNDMDSLALTRPAQVMIKSLQERIKSLNQTLEKERRVRKMQDEARNIVQRVG
jgi:protoporphyrinogen oxidase